MIQKAKQLANEIQQSSVLWDLEHYLTERRKEIDRKYEFRSSRLARCLGRSCGNVESARKSCAA